MCLFNLRGGLRCRFWNVEFALSFLLFIVADKDIMADISRGAILLRGGDFLHLYSVILVSKCDQTGLERSVHLAGLLIGRPLLLGMRSVNKHLGAHLLTGGSADVLLTASRVHHLNARCSVVVLQVLN